MSNFERIIPVLTYQDIPAAHDFLVNAFGFNGGGVYRNAEGQPIHGEVRAGDATIWLHRVTQEHRFNSPLASDVANSGLFVHVEMSMRTTSGRARLVRSSILNRSISHMDSASMARGILKGTDGGLRLRRRFGVRGDHNARE